MAGQFREGSGLTMFTSDVSARGVDYPDVSLVVQVPSHLSCIADLMPAAVLCIPCLSLLKEAVLLVEGIGSENQCMQDVTERCAWLGHSHHGLHTVDELCSAVQPPQ